MDEILEKCERFTQAEKERFNAIATQSNKDALTFEDLELYARFKVDAALTSERFEMERQERLAKRELELETATELKALAIERMKAKRDAAKAKLKAVNANGEISK